MQPPGDSGFAKSPLLTPNLFWGAPKATVELPTVVTISSAIVTAKLGWKRYLPGYWEIKYVYTLFSKALWDSVVNSTTYISIQYTDAQNTVLCFLAEKVGEIHACWSKTGSDFRLKIQYIGKQRISGDKWQEISYLYQPTGFHVESRWSSEGLG